MTAARIFADQLQRISALHDDWRSGRLASAAFDAALSAEFGKPAAAAAPEPRSEACELLAFLKSEGSEHPQYGTWTTETENRVLAFLRRCTR